MFEGKTIIVTGSTQGIGLALARKLGGLGANLVINSRTEEKVQKVVREFEENNLPVAGFTGDVSDYECCVQLCQTAVDKFGGIDLLINNAAVTARGTLEESNPDIFDKLMTVNVLGSLYPTKAALDELKKAKGGVLFISSLAGIISLPGYSAYCSTKKTLISIAESLKVEMTEHNVFVGIYMAGFTKNDARKTILNPDGTPQPIPERKDVKVNSQEKTVNKIVSQLKRKKFMGFTSFQGRLIYVAYRFFPGLILFILKKNRKKIMPLD